MAKFIKLVKEDHTYKGMKYEEGLNVSVVPMPNIPLYDLGGITFTNTDWLQDWYQNDNSLTWVYDVEIPDGELFVSLSDYTYVANRVILSNPRKFYKADPISCLQIWLCIYS